MTTVFHNGKIFTGDDFLYGAKLLVEAGTIKKITTSVNEKTDHSIDLQEGMLVPAFIDLQLYGGNGKLFGEHPSVEALTATYEYCLKGGAPFFMPTVATNSTAVMMAAIEAVKNYWDKGLPGVLGLHLEGPFINPQKKGAHIEQFIHKPIIEEVKSLVSKGEGIIKMMTIAPEVCSSDVIQYLVSHRIILSAGHTNATYQQAMEGFEMGIPLATHLYNAMSPLQHRAPGMVGAIFNHHKAMASIVADGHHVDFAAIAIAKKIMGERLFLITDAVTVNTEGYYQHRLEGDKYVVTDGTLSGSALTILQAIRNCVEKVNISLPEALRMGSLYPARAMRLENKLGRIAEGYSAELVWLNDELEIKGVFTNGSIMRF